MTRVEFVRERFMENIQTAIQTIDVNKGKYHQYLDSWDHLIKIDFEIVDEKVIIADIKAEWETDNAFTAKYYDLKGYARIETTIEDALVELVGYAQRVTGYKPSGIEE